MDFIVVRMASGKTLPRDLGASRIRMGRHSQNELVLPDLNLERIHAEIYREGKDCLIRDLGSKIGTYLNLAQVKAPTVLKKGDQIILGTTTVWFNVDPRKLEGDS
jgi:pSer/pThr/pTyr-binding forkhead associated (FHA) protein